METYTYEEAFRQSMEYFNGNDLAASVFLNKYALRNNKDEILEPTPYHMHKRIASEIARIEKLKFKKNLTEDFIFALLDKFKYIIPQGSPMYGIGNHYSISSLSNCFVVESPCDSYGGICKTDQEIVQISKRRGGIGYDISNLRPDKTAVTNSARTTSGATSFMHRFSNTGREVGQNGRRAAQMITISVHHPDVIKFATIKNDDISVTGANISIRLTDEFLKAVKDNKEYEQRWPVDSKEPKIRQMVSAREVWNTIIHSAWLRAEPGLLFWDNILRESPADYWGMKTVSTNPCGEIPLSVDDSCRLIVNNLINYVVNPYTPEAYFDFDAFYQNAKISQRIMDDIIDLEIECVERILAKINNDPEPHHIKQIEYELWASILENAKLGRRTGTGITALGDTLAALGLKYGSEESIEMTDKIYRTLKHACYESSVEMAKEIGPAPIMEEKKSIIYKESSKKLATVPTSDTNSVDYEIKETVTFDMDINCPFILRIKEENPNLYNKMIKHGRRNIACLTTAPTGTVSILASISIGDKVWFGTTSGIEPCIIQNYTRRKKGNPNDEGFRVDYVDKLGDSWMEFDVYHPGIYAWQHVNPDKQLSDNPYVNSCSNDINWLNRVRLQASAQKHVDHSISSTINLPNDVKEEEVALIYEESWKVGCKGITVYRDGCRSGVLIKREDKDKTTKERPKELPCDVHHVTVGGQQYFILVGLVDGTPYEVFAGKNGMLDKGIKTGKIIKKKKNVYKAEFENDFELSPITAAMSELEEIISRLTSGLLRSGADMHFIVTQLEKVGESREIHSFSRSIARALKKYIPDGTKESGECPECQSTNLIRQEGCINCKTCGWSKCL